jgi:hypothetical protein
LVKDLNLNLKPLDPTEKKINLLQIPKTTAVAHCDIAILRVGETFGEEELISGEKRHCSAICNSITGSLYVIKKKVKIFFGKI